MNPYGTYLRKMAAQFEKAKSYPLGEFAALRKPKIKPGAPTALIFSPHPDDEVIVGGLALRLLRESGWRVVNVAVTQGSNKARQQGRWEELQRCCDYIGFEVLQTKENGLEGVNLRTREGNPAKWLDMVERIAEILRDQAPRVIFFPHDSDSNSTHIGTHYLLMDALGQLGNGFGCFTVETEFWGAIETPNLMVESSVGDLVDLVTALTFHVGEVRRNPYHLRLMGWMLDNVRRGGELVGVQGGAPPDFLLATLHRLRRWEKGEFHRVLAEGRFVSQEEDPAELFPA